MPKRKHHLTKRKNHSKIELMAQEVNLIITHPNRNRNILIAVGVILFAIIFFFVLIYFDIINLSPSSPSKALPVAKVGNPRALDTCALSKEGNPLVDELSTQLGTVQGSLKGKISDLEMDEVRGSVIFKLKSLDEAQEYKFNLIDKENFIINLITNKIASSSALKNGQLIRATFVCNQETNLLEFTRLNILPNPPTATQSGTLKK